MTLSTAAALAKLFGQYLLQPIPFTLTFLLPLLFRLIARKYCAAAPAHWRPSWPAVVLRLSGWMRPRRC